MKIAFITQSYKDDYKECKLLCESIDKFVPGEIIHYIFVNDLDIALFKHLGNERRVILPKSAIIPNHLFQLPFQIKGHNIWLSPITIPVRGWIIQQIVKLGVFECVDADCFVNIDSEVVFVKQFNKDMIVQDGRVLLHRQTKMWTYKSRKIYNEAASKLLKIPNGEYLMKSYYMSTSFCFTKIDLLKLTNRIKENSIINNWKMPLLNTYRFSEYMLYGIFIEHILGFESSGHYISEEGFVIEPWELSDYNALSQKINNLSNQKEVAVLLQKGSRLNTKHLSFDDNKKIIYNAWDLLNK